MNTGIPGIADLMEATLGLLRMGTSDSATMRKELARRFKLDPEDGSWWKFVNNHAWALVRLQQQERIRKTGPGRYEIIELPKPVQTADEVIDATPEIRDDEPLPRWARILVSTATSKNAKRWGKDPFERDDLIALWKAAEGCCMLTKLPFRETSVGTGKARRPYAPSLDRINSSEPYTRENCRLVLQAVNFALNAWGDDVFLTIAEGAVRAKPALD